MQPSFADRAAWRPHLIRVSGRVKSFLWTWKFSFDLSYANAHKIQPLTCRSQRPIIEPYDGQWGSHRSWAFACDSSIPFEFSAAHQPRPNQDCFRFFARPAWPWSPRLTSRNLSGLVLL